MAGLDWNTFPGSPSPSGAGQPPSSPDVTGSVTEAPASSLDWGSFPMRAADQQIAGSQPILQTTDHFQPEAPKPASHFTAANGGYVPNAMERQVLGQEASDAATLDAAPAAKSPWWTAADAAVNSAGMNIPRNIGAGVRSMVRGTTFDDEYNFLKNASDASARENPKASGAGALAGYGAMALAAPELLPVRAGLVAKGVQGGLTGGAISGVSEYADSHDVGKALDAGKTGLVIGAVASPVLETVGSAVANAVSRRFYNPKTTEMLKTEADAAYKTARDAGLVLKSDGVKTLATDVEAELKANGYHPKLQPKAAVVLEELDNLGSGNVTLDGLDNLRKIANTLRMDSDAATRNLGRLAISKIDDYLEKLTPGQIASGHGPEAVKAIQDARSLWSSFRKSEVIDDLMTKARQNADNGTDYERAIKTQFKSLLQSKSRSAGFTPAEKGAIARVVSGSDPQKIAKMLAAFAPTGGILGKLALGSSLFTPKGAMLSAAGAATKAASEGATTANVTRLGNIVRSGKSGDVVSDDAALAVRQFLTSVGVNVDRISGLPPEKLAEYFPEVSY